MLPEEMQKRIFLFLGSNGVGKSSLMLHTAKVLANDEHKLLLMDTTTEQDVYNHFIMNEAIEEQLSLTNQKPFIRHDIDVMCDNSILHKHPIDYKRLENYQCFTEYDALIIEGDETINPDWLENATVFLVYNMERDKFIRTQHILTMLREHRINKVFHIYNQMIKCKMKKEYLMDGIAKKNSSLLTNCDEIEISYEEQNLIASIDNRCTGKIDLRDFSKEYKAAIFEIANNLITTKERRVNKIVF